MDVLWLCAVNCSVALCCYNVEIGFHVYSWLTRSHHRVRPTPWQRFTFSLENGWLFYYRATRMHSADYAVERCLSVCPSVTRRYCVYTYPRSFISYPGSPIILVFHTKRDGNIPTGTPPLTEATNAKGYKNHDFQPISCFILQTMQDRAIVSLEGE